MQETEPELKSNQLVNQFFIVGSFPYSDSLGKVSER
jgi:hypothetical protein